MRSGGGDEWDEVYYKGKEGKFNEVKCFRPSRKMNCQELVIRLSDHLCFCQIHVNTQ